MSVCMTTTSNEKYDTVHEQPLTNMILCLKSNTTARSQVVCRTLLFFASLYSCDGQERDIEWDRNEEEKIRQKKNEVIEIVRQSKRPIQQRTEKHRE